MTNQELLEFLIDLNKSDLNVSPWEADFIESIFKRKQVSFTPKQTDVILKLMDKYDRRLP